MPTTTLHPVTYPATRELRALAAERAAGREQQPGAVAPGAQPTAADPFGAAVVNHVRPAGTAASEVDDSYLRERALTKAGQNARAGENDDAARTEAESGKPDREVDEAKSEEVSKLKARDIEVRAHEQAHAAVGGAFAGAPSYGFERGPDGVSYAVSGEVTIDVSPVSGDPEATIAKMQQVKRAALAPQSPSGADRSIASAADAAMAAARLELMANVGKSAPQGDSASGTSDAQAAGAPTPISDDDPRGQTPAAGEAARDLFSKLVHRSAYRTA